MIGEPFSFSLGSSPRVRSRPDSKNAQKTEAGIISACAEQTHETGCPAILCVDHLRVCGADCSGVFYGLIYEGSSPRVRSRQTSDR